MNAETAKKKLRKWEKVLVFMLKDVLKGPWHLDPDDPDGCGPICSPEWDGNDGRSHHGAIVSRGPELYGDKGGYKTMKFIAFSREAMEAMLEGIRSVLDCHEGILTLSKVYKGAGMGIYEQQKSIADLMLVSLAQAYESCGQKEGIVLG